MPSFQVGEADINGFLDSGTVQVLSPGPTYVIYPERFDPTVRVSRDGNPTIQSPLKDGRPRSWVWRRYRFDTKGYDPLFKLLWNLHYKLRLEATPAKSEWAFVKEDVTENLSKRQWTGTEWENVIDWIRVKVIQVDQEIAQHGGKVVYEQTTFTFIIDDDSWNGF